MNFLEQNSFSFENLFRLQPGKRGEQVKTRPCGELFAYVFLKANKVFFEGLTLKLISFSYLLTSSLQKSAV